MVRIPRPDETGERLGSSHGVMGECLSGVRSIVRWLRVFRLCAYDLNRPSAYKSADGGVRCSVIQPTGHNFKLGCSPKISQLRDHILFVIWPPLFKSLLISLLFFSHLFLFYFFSLLYKYFRKFPLSNSCYT